MNILIQSNNNGTTFDVSHHRPDMPAYYVTKLYSGGDLDNCTDLYFLSTIACQLAECTPENGKLIVLATSLTALGDMLSVIAARRDLCMLDENPDSEIR